MGIKIIPTTKGRAASVLVAEGCPRDLARKTVEDMVANDWQNQLLFGAGKACVVCHDTARKKGPWNVMVKESSDARAAGPWKGEE